MRNIVGAALSRRQFAILLRAFDALAVAVSVGAFLFGTYATYLNSPWHAARFLTVLVVPFILVSLVRRAINAPRPTEMLDGLKDGHRGASFPSRHAFSAFAIGTLLLFISLPLGVVTLAFGVLLGACRVLLGIHFPRDVIAGAVTGVVTSLIGALFL